MQTKLRVNKTDFKILKKEFTHILNNIIKNKVEISKGLIEGKDRKLLQESHDKKELDAYFISHDFKTCNDEFGVSALKKVLLILKTDTRYWSRGLLNLYNTENKLNFLQVKNNDGYKLISFLLDYADKTNSWSDIDLIGNIEFYAYENKEDIEIFHFLRTIITNNSFLGRYGINFDREKNQYIKTDYVIRFTPTTEGKGLEKLIVRYTNCIKKNEYSNLPYDADREEKVLLSLKDFVSEDTKKIIDEFLESMKKNIGRI